MAKNKKPIHSIFKSLDVVCTDSGNISNLSSGLGHSLSNISFDHNREQLLSKNVAKELNTYANFGIFPTFADTYPDVYKAITKKDNNGVTYTIYEPDHYKYNTHNYDQGLGTPGVKSLFNKAGAMVIGVNNFDGGAGYNVNLNRTTPIVVGYSDNKDRRTDTMGVNKSFSTMNEWRISRNVPLLDSPNIRQTLRKKLGCTIKELVHASEHGDLGLETYSYADFMYCKHLGKMPNNYMITLRRFPYPVGDYIGTDSYLHSEESEARNTIQSNLPATSVGCMVTWMGVSGNNLNEILRYSYKQPFKEQVAELQDTKTDADTNTSLLSGMFSAFDKSYQKAYTEGTHGKAVNAAFSHFGINLGDPPYTDHARFKDRNKVYGPVDAIKSTYIRSDEGMVFNHKFSLTFEYELRAYNGINPRQAMLDLISNILNVTYTTGSFWGGGIKGYGAQQSNIFANLNIFKVKGGTFAEYTDAFSKDLSTISSNIAISSGLANKGTDGKINPTKNVMAQVLNALKGAVNTLGGMLVSGMLNKLGRPQKAMYNSLLSPAPIGFWHVTIGNPKAPIMSIGNLVLTNVTVEHNGPLGLDNFPTGLKVTVELDRGKPRDLREIEKLYMHGNDRIYSSMTDKVFNMYKHAIKYRNIRDNKSSSFDDFDTTDIKLTDSHVEQRPNTDWVTLHEETKNIKTWSDGNVFNRGNTDYNTAKDAQQTVKYQVIYNESDAEKLHNALKDDEDTLKQLKKYYGKKDIQSIYISATEQEYGSTKKKKTIVKKRKVIQNFYYDSTLAGTGEFANLKHNEIIDYSVKTGRIYGQYTSKSNEVVYTDDSNFTKADNKIFDKYITKTETKK